MKFNDDLEKQIQLAKIAKAIGHPTRIAILLFLKERNSCYFGSIHEELPIAKATGYQFDFHPTVGLHQVPDYHTVLLQILLFLQQMQQQ